MVCKRTTAETGARYNRLSLDHNHGTGEFRGSCNAGLGMLGDNPNRVEAAARYLRDRNGGDAK
jgi:hypothetical protein